MKRVLFIAFLFALTACRHHESSQPHVKVYKGDGSIQCQNDGATPDAMAMELINAGIDVVCSQKGSTGLVYPAVCGGATGAINVYTIHTSNLVDAQALGFHPVSELGGYQDQECK